MSGERDDETPDGAAAGHRPGGPGGGRRLRIALGVAGALLLVAGVAAVVAGRENRLDRPVATGPNIVVIMTDDQTLLSLSVMEQTQRLIGEEGTTFSNAFVTFPNCCPSRATYLTGQYTHNHGVRDNVPPHGGVDRLDDGETLPVWLQEAGYETVHIGKYLNGWGQDRDISAPPGWDRWYSLIDPTTYRYYDYEISVDGERVRFGDDDADYSTDALAAEAVAQIEQRADRERPFFLSFTPLAPHNAQAERPAGTASSGSRRFSTPVAPRRHAATFLDRRLDYGPAVDREDVSELPEGVRRDRLTQQSRDFIERYEIAELGSLLAVDEAVAEIVATLEREGILDDTVILFTSDNGVFHGEHRIVTGKFLLYDPAVRVPLLVRGGPFAAGADITRPVINADLAPTILALAGAVPSLEPDGADLAEVAADASPDRAVLLANYARGEPASTGVRTRRWTYLEHVSGERELFDAVADPHQLDNLHGDRASAEVEAALAALLDELRDCQGAGCQVAVPPELSSD